MANRKSDVIANRDVDFIIEHQQDRRAAEKSSKILRNIMVFAGLLLTVASFEKLEQFPDNAADYLLDKLYHDFGLQLGVGLVAAAGVSYRFNRSGTLVGEVAENADIELYRLQQEYKHILTAPLHKYSRTPERYEKKYHAEYHRVLQEIKLQKYDF